VAPAVGFEPTTNRLAADVSGGLAQRESGFGTCISQSPALAASPVQARDRVRWGDWHVPDQDGMSESFESCPARRGPEQA